MLSRLKLLYIDADLLSPDEFPRIVSPSSACHELSYGRGDSVFIQDGI